MITLLPDDCVSIINKWIKHNDILDKYQPIRFIPYGSIEDLLELSTQLYNNGTLHTARSTIRELLDTHIFVHEYDGGPHVRRRDATYRRIRELLDPQLQCAEFVSRDVLGDDDHVVDE